MILPDNTHLLAQVQVVSFDLDDTFWHCGPAIQHAENTLFTWMQSNTSRITEFHTVESLARHRLQMVKTHPQLHCDVTLMRQTWLAQILREFDYPTELAADAFAVFYQARSEVDLYDGVHELLQALRARYRLAAITNGNANLQSIGIAHYFDDIQHASVDNAPKPDAEMFRRCVARFSLPPSALLHVGDNPETDVGGGHNAGALAVWFNQQAAVWPDNLPAPQFEVNSIPQLQQLLV